MNIDGINGVMQGIEPITKPQGTQAPKGASGVEADSKGSFGELLGRAISDLNTMQLDADKKIEDMVVGRGNVTAHEAMIALEKADVAFQLMNQVRSKIVRAYEEVLRTQV